MHTRNFWIGLVSSVVVIAAALGLLYLLESRDGGDDDDARAGRVVHAAPARA